MRLFSKDTADAATISVNRMNPVFETTAVSLLKIPFQNFLPKGS